MKKLLIANRGEIACRIARTARELGLATVAVHTDVDAGALHVQVCDEAVLLGAEGHGSPYLDVARLLEAARRTGADAIHPGYGFLSERAEFAEAVLAAGLTWVGPPPEVMAALGRKDAAKALARSFDVPVLPGFELAAGAMDASLVDAVNLAELMGYPLLIKAVAGGGGRGMRIVRAVEELEPALHLACAEAKDAFGDGALLVEKYVEHGRHVEVQILADSHGAVLTLGERECSIQRRHQKLIEETPSPGLTPVQREALHAAALRLAAGVGYISAGTVEFLLDEAAGQFYFLEVNTRIQVEHPVTEAVTGLDLIAWQLHIAQGQALTLRQEDVAPRGHAIEARLCAEDPRRAFLPQAGPVLRWQPPVAPGLRVDHGLHPQDTVGIHYDPLLAKIVAWGSDRSTAVALLVRGLASTRLHGLICNRAYLMQMLQTPDFLTGATTTAFVARHPPEPRLAVDDATLVAVALWRHADSLRRRFRNHTTRPDVTVLVDGSAWYHVALAPRGPDRFAWGVSREPDPLLWQVPELVGEVVLAARDADMIALEWDGRRRRWDVTANGDTLWAQASDGPEFLLREETLLPVPHPKVEATGSVTAPGPALVADVHVTSGETVEADAPLVTLEAMKMLTILRAPRAGVVLTVRAAKGEAVAAGYILVEMEEA